MSPQLFCLVANRNDGLLTTPQVRSTGYERENEYKFGDWRRAESMETFVFLRGQESRPGNNSASVISISFLRLRTLLICALTDPGHSLDKQPSLQPHPIIDIYRTRRQHLLDLHQSCKLHLDVKDR